MFVRITTIVAAWALGACAAFAFSTKPVYVHETPVDLTPAGGFDVPLKHFPDFGAFTIAAKLRFDEKIAPGESVALFDQMSGETGWRMQMTGTPWGPHLDVQVNGVNCGLDYQRIEPGSTHEYVLTARDGLVVVYDNGRPLRHFVAAVSPASRPLRVGYDASRPAKGVKLLDLRVFGPKEKFYAKGESRKPASGYRVGAGWMVKGPYDDTKALPRLLYYGDSISHGYTWPLQKRLAGKAHLYHWSGFLGAVSFDEKMVQGVCGVAKYDVIVFNNGLHSLERGWQTASDDTIRGIYRDFARAFKKYAPQAKLVYMETTPQTGAKGADGKVTGMGKLNFMVLRLNKLADEAMREEGVAIIPAYALLEKKLEWASGDGYHWHGPAYEILADQVAAQMTGVKGSKKK